MADTSDSRARQASGAARAAGRTQWRRKWRRTAPERRAVAAAGLDDLFRRRRSDRILRVVLLASLAVHAATLPFVTFSRATGVDLEAKENTYYSRVVEKERAKVVSRTLSGRITMPPPPDDPEAFVSDTMDQSLTSDIDTVIGSMLPVTVTSKIKDKVSASLKADLAAAAKKIAEQRLSESEIQDLQESFRRKAHAAALKALKEHRIETQVERAAMSTTQWYEQKVSQVLFTNLKHEMYERPSWNKGPRIWYTTWAGGSNTPRWHELVSLDEIDRKLRYLQRVLDGHLPVKGEDRYKTDAVKDDEGRLFVKDSRKRNIAVIHAGWPGPSLAQARHLKQGFHNLYNRSPGGYKNQELIPSWNDWMNPSPQCYGLIAEYYPHRAAEMQKRIDAVDALWKRLFEHLAEYVRAAEAGDEAEMKVHQKAFSAAAKVVFAKSRALFPDHYVHRACHTINRAILLERLRDPALQVAHHQRWSETMVKTLWPLIRTYAEGQFEEGIIKRDGTVAEALKAFGQQILPLVRRDVERLLPQDKFNRIIFYPYRYRSKITNNRCPPSDNDFKAAQEAMAAEIKRHPELKAYAEKRRQLLAEHFGNAVVNVVQVTRRHIFARGLLTKRIDLLAEGVDYADRVQEKMDSRKAAKEGRGQDLARLNTDGLPDTSARLVALQYGLARGGLVDPVALPDQPGFITEQRPDRALWSTQPRKPPHPAKWGFQTQKQIKPTFQSPAFEAIPFLSRFPALDGDLSDWGRIRPLVLRPYEQGSQAEPICLYAAWNYQGFFFGYKVRQPAAEFFYPEQYRTKAAHRASWEGGGFTGNIRTVREQGVAWMCKGDHLRLLFDTLDARSPTRGDPHTQEFVVLPMGCDTDGTLPGHERIIQSRRDAKATEWRRIVASGKAFLPQPPREHGPDGTGPYRVTKVQSEGPIEDQYYSVEAFIPRSLFNVPVFAPGWNIGFDCAVAVGRQGQFKGQHWSPHADAVPGGDGVGVSPRTWGDLLLLGTDPYIVVQDADPAAPVSQAMMPGHSYLLTVIDPDRNVYASAKDTILVSAEVVGTDQDMEVFILTETAANSGIFRGYVNTQPGRGRNVRGVIEAMPGQEVRFGYVDIGNAKGKRNVIFELRLPVVAPVTSVVVK